MDESDGVYHFCFEPGAYFTWCCWHLIAEPADDVPYDKVIGENDEVVHDIQLCTCPGLEYRREEERQALERARQEGWAPWGTEAMWRKIREHVNRTVAKWPPLNEDQRSRLAVLLRPK